MKSSGKLLLLILVSLCTQPMWAAQESTPIETPQQALSRLARQIEKVEAQMESSQHQLAELKEMATELEHRIAGGAEVTTNDRSTSPATRTAKSPTDAESMQEQQEMQTSQIATLDQSKVESESRYGVKVGGLVLFSSLVNTRGVDQSTAPTAAYPGGGSTTATLRQTVLSVAAQGPTIAGGVSHADLQVDFFGSTALNNSPYSSGLLRVRTAHGTLDWKHTRAFFELDRPIIAPLTPTSLTALAVPPLAWSGNLWAWSPQAGITQKASLGNSQFSYSAAVIDVGDAPTSPVANTTQAELSRWPGAELHLDLQHRRPGRDSAIGAGGYFSPHKTPGGLNYNAWAATVDLDLHLPGVIELTGSAYRGASLGGLGGGAYKDYLFYIEASRPAALALDDVGGWVQLKRPLGQRLQFNAALGFDQAFSSQLRQYGSSAGGRYLGTARNRTFFANAIYSPLAYLNLSFEYRHITTVPVSGNGLHSDIIGFAAGYKF